MPAGSTPAGIAVRSPIEWVADEVGEAAMSYDGPASWREHKF